MAKKTKLHLEDIEIVATLVAKILRDRREEGAPGADDFVLGSVHGNGSTALEVRLKLTPSLPIDLVGYWWPGQELEDLVTLAGDIADAIAVARTDIAGTEAFVADVTKEARRQVANARRRGLRYRLLSVTPSDVDIDSPREPCAIMRIEMLNRALVRETAAFDVEDLEEIGPIFRGSEAEQRARSVARCALEADDATGEIDAVLVRALEQRGVDVADVLTRMQDVDHILDVEVPGSDRKMPLFWDEGVVRSSISLSEGTTWCKGSLTFLSAPKGVNDKLVGKPVKTVLDHPYLLPDARVTWAYNATPGGYATVSCTDRLLRFNGYSGRVWERHAA